MGSLYRPTYRGTDGTLKESAIIIRAGEGKEDRLMSGSYQELRDQEAAKKKASAKPAGSGDYLPEFLK